MHTWCNVYTQHSHEACELVLNEYINHVKCHVQAFQCYNGVFNYNVKNLAKYFDKFISHPPPTIRTIDNFYHLLNFFST
jgi:hypothetical protein